MGLLGNGAHRGSAGSPTAFPCPFLSHWLNSGPTIAGRMVEAKEHLRRAIKLDKDIRGLALNDEDLKPLWDWIGGLK